MKSGNHTLHGTVGSNKIQPFLMIKASMKYGKWLGTMESGSKL